MVALPLNDQVRSLRGTLERGVLVWIIGSYKAQDFAYVFVLFFQNVITIVTKKKLHKIQTIVNSFLC